MPSASIERFDRVGMPRRRHARVGHQQRALDAEPLELPARVGGRAGPELDRRGLEGEDRFLTHIPVSMPDSAAYRSRSACPRSGGAVASRPDLDEVMDEPKDVVRPGPTPPGIPGVGPSLPYAVKAGVTYARSAAWMARTGGRAKATRPADPALPPGRRRRRSARGPAAPVRPPDGEAGRGRLPGARADGGALAAPDRRPAGARGRPHVRRRLRRRARRGAADPRSATDSARRCSSPRA